MRSAGIIYERKLVKKIKEVGAASAPDSPEERARQLIRAIDAGGLPLKAGIVNDIARSLGLEVSARARLENTIARIRAALERL